MDVCNVLCLRCIQQTNLGAHWGTACPRHANQWQLLKAIGVLEDDKATTGRKGRQRALKVWMWMVVSAHLHASTWLLCVSMQNGSRGRMIT
eukprot:scaffold73609_cov15-Tisochrysis_lutea.AAC.1